MVGRLLLLEAGVQWVQPAMLQLRTGAEGCYFVLLVADGGTGCWRARADPVQSACLKPEPAGRAATCAARQKLRMDQDEAINRKQGVTGASTLQVAGIEE